MEAPAGPVVAVVLAAGGGERYAGPTHKLLAPLADGRAVLAHAVAAAVASAVGPVVLVLGAVLPEALPPLPAEVRVAVNPRWAEGQATSLRVGIEAARDLGAAAVVVGLGDQPGLAAEAWRLVAAAPAPVAVATYADGRRGQPVRLAADVWPLLPTEGDEGARSLLRARPDLVAEVPCPGSPADIDTVDDLARWTSA